MFKEKPVEFSLTRVNKERRNPLSYSYWSMGGSHTPSYSSVRYFLSIVYDFSKKFCVYPQKTKDEAFENSRTGKV